jgi:hypothetical protein
MEDTPNKRPSEDGRDINVPTDAPGQEFVDHGAPLAVTGADVPQKPHTPAKGSGYGHGGNLFDRLKAPLTKVRGEQGKTGVSRGQAGDVEKMTAAESKRVDAPETKSRDAQEGKQDEPKARSSHLNMEDLGGEAMD